jgi:hypothetical protein
MPRTTETEEAADTASVSRKRADHAAFESLHPDDAGMTAIAATCHVRTVRHHPARP